MKRILILTLVFYSLNSFGQDVLKGYTFDRYEIANQQLDSIVRAFIKAEAACLIEDNNTVVIAYYDANAIGDTNAITLRVIHARDLSGEDCIGYVKYPERNVFLYKGMLNNDFFTKVSIPAQMLMISQRITFGNYLINDTDTLFLAGTRPYEAQWIIFELKGYVFRGPKYDFPCNIEEERSELKKLIDNEGWRQPLRIEVQ